VANASNARTERELPGGANSNVDIGCLILKLSRFYVTGKVEVKSEEWRVASEERGVKREEREEKGGIYLDRLDCVGWASPTTIH